MNDPVTHLPGCFALPRPARPEYDGLIYETVSGNRTADPIARDRGRRDALDGRPCAPRTISIRPGWAHPGTLGESPTHMLAGGAECPACTAAARGAYLAGYASAGGR